MATGPVGANTGQSRLFDVKFSWRHGTSVHQTGFSVRRSGALLGEAQELAEYADTSLRSTVRGLLPPTDLYLGVDVVDPIAKTGYTVSPANVFGSRLSGAMGPGFVCAVISLKSEIRARYGQGRMFAPAYFEGWIDGDNLGEDGRNAIGEFVTALTNTFTDTIGPQPWLLVNWHRDLAAGRPNNTRPTVPAVPATWYDVESLRLNFAMTALRSRKVGVGS